MSNNSKGPFKIFRDGKLKATIWQNESANGHYFYSVEFSRRYKDSDGNYRSITSFVGVDLLRVAHLANRAYGFVNETIRSDLERRL